LNRGGAVGIAIATGDGPDGQGSIPGKGIIFLFSTASKSALAPLQWVLGAIFPKVKEPRLKAEHLPSSSAEVKNVGAIPPLPHIFTVELIRHRYNFSLLLLLLYYSSLTP
jgi:hypothetical protein